MPGANPCNLWVLCVGAGRVGPPNGSVFTLPWVQTPFLGGLESPGCLAPPAQQAARCHQTFSSSWCGGGALGAMRSPSALLPARTACMLRQWATRARAPRAGRAALAGVSSVGGCLRVRAVGSRAAGAQTARLRAPPPSGSTAERKGSSSPCPGSSGPQPGSWGPHLGAVDPTRSGPVQGWQGGRERLGGWARATWGHDAWCMHMQGGIINATSFCGLHRGGEQGLDPERWRGALGVTAVGPAGGRRSPPQCRASPVAEREMAKWGSGVCLWWRGAGSLQAGVRAGGSGGELSRRASP